MEDARDYCMMGCVEPQKAGRLYQWTSTAYTQWPVCIELTLNHGKTTLVRQTGMPGHGTIRASIKPMNSLKRL